MASLLVNALKTTFHQFPKFTIQSTSQLHQIASRITAMPTQPPRVCAPGAPIIPCGSLTHPALIGCGWFTQSVRHKIRDYYPKPRETKRFQYTYWNRIKTRGGRMILMRRLIKGRHILAYPI